MHLPHAVQGDRDVELDAPFHTECQHGSAVSEDALHGQAVGDQCERSQVRHFVHKQLCQPDQILPQAGFSPRQREPLDAMEDPVVQHRGEVPQAHLFVAFLLPDVAHCASRVAAIGDIHLQLAWRQGAEMAQNVVLVKPVGDETPLRCKQPAQGRMAHGLLYSRPSASCK